MSYIGCRLIPGKAWPIYMDASSLLIYASAVKGQQDGRETFVLGGAEGNMREYKQTFTKDCCFDYYAGKRIRNPEIYEMLTKANGVLETGYFPAYRDNGHTQYMVWTTNQQ